MSTAFKVFITVLSAVFIVAGGFAVTLAFSSAVSTNDYFESVSAIIVASNYSEDVIRDCISDAADSGYELTVLVEGGSKPGQAKYMKIQMKYDFEINLFGFSQEKVKTKVL